MFLVLQKKINQPLTNVETVWQAVFYFILHFLRFSGIIRGSLRKKAFNDSRKRAMKEVIKKIEKIAKTDKNEALKMLSSAFAIIDKAAQKNVIKKNNAARKKSRLARITK